MKSHGRFLLNIYIHQECISVLSNKIYPPRERYAEPECWRLRPARVSHFKAFWQSRPYFCYVRQKLDSNSEGTTVSIELSATLKYL
jgi:hypothetical protein